MDGAADALRWHSLERMRRFQEEAIEARGFHDLDMSLDVVLLLNERRMFAADPQQYLIGEFSELLRRRGDGPGTVVFLGDAYTDPVPHEAHLDATPDLERFVIRHKESPRVYALLGSRFYSPNPLENTMLQTSGRHEHAGGGNLGFYHCAGIGMSPPRFMEYGFVSAMGFAEALPPTSATLYFNDGTKGVRRLAPDLDSGWVHGRMDHIAKELRYWNGGNVRHHLLRA